VTDIQMHALHQDIAKNMQPIVSDVSSAKEISSLFALSCYIKGKKETQVQM